MIPIILIFAIATIQAWDDRFEGSKIVILALSVPPNPI